MNQTTQDARHILTQVSDLFQRLSPSTPSLVDELGALYDEEVVFRDPLQRLEGREAFVEMNRRFVRHSRVLKIALHQSVASGNDLFLTWTMDYARKRGPTVSLEGVTHLRLKNSRIAYHRDYWDLLSTVLAIIPGLGRVYRSLAPHLA